MYTERIAEASSGVKQRTRHRVGCAREPILDQLGSEPQPTYSFAPMFPATSPPRAGRGASTLHPAGHPPTVLLRARSSVEAAVATRTMVDQAAESLLRSGDSSDRGRPTLAASGRGDREAHQS